MAAPRPLRIPGVYPVAGALLFVVFAIAAWSSGARVIAAPSHPARKQALAGLLLLLPWGLIALLWVGIGAPFQATISENHMRYLVLLTNSLLFTGALFVLREVLSEAGERFYSALGFATNFSAGLPYLLSIMLTVAQTSMAIHGNRMPLPPVLDNLYDVLEFIGCVMTYATTAVFAISMSKAGLLGRNATRICVFFCALLTLCLLLRGLEYPEISSSTAPWYTQPGVIASIPASPWIMPGLLGAVLLREAGAARK